MVQFTMQDILKHIQPDELSKKELEKILKDFNK